MSTTKLRPFPTKEELETMPINRLRNLDIESRAQEEIVQEILSRKLTQKPREISVNVRKDIDIGWDSNAPKESELQARVDKQMARDLEKVALQGLISEADLPPPAPPVIPQDPIPVEETPQEPVIPPADNPVQTTAKYKPKRRSKQS